MTDRELMQQALEALKQAKDAVADWGSYASEYFQEKHDLQGELDAIQAQMTALRERLAQPEQEPVAWRNAALRVGEDLCSVGPFGYYDMTAEQWLDWALSVVTVHAPPRREWVGLTDEEIEQVCVPLGAAMLSFPEVARAIEAKLKEKNA